MVKQFRVSRPHSWDSRELPNLHLSSERQPLLKLCIITQFYPPDYAATGQLIEDLAHHLGRRNIQVDVFTGQPGYAFDQTSAPSMEQLGPVQVRRSHLSRLWPQRIRGKTVNGLLFCLRAGFYLLRASRRCDIVLLTTAPPFLQILGYLANLCFGLPFVCLLYDLYPDIAVKLGVVSPHHWLACFWQKMNRLIWRRAEEIIVLSPAMKRRVASHCPEVKDKISVIHNWADPAQIIPVEKPRNWFAWKHGLVEPFVVLYSGNMGRCHDMATILAAASQLQGHGQSKPIQFVFIGDGAQRLYCLEQASRLGLENCRFLPYQDRETLPYSLTACDLSLVSIGSDLDGLVSPSKFYSALAAGRPVAVICEKRSYLSRLVTKMGCGAAFENGDAEGLAEFIRYLSADPQMAERMGRQGRLCLTTKFSPELSTARYAQVLQGAISREKPTTSPATT
ncbi:MAG: glycosyltransferase family 4 protein [Leptolyngbyaceae cyanobacterium MO_188.B28]|nr:glycosyltransferase family 4 protein [Leptolyngbyaceae cyanobacterium MO_188.B28]